MRKLFKALRFVLFPLYYISGFIKRESTLWLFGAHQNRFCENTKAFFIYTHLQNSVITPIWISGDKSLVRTLKKEGYRAYCRWSLRGVYLSLKAGYYFYNVYIDDCNFYTSKGAKLVNLWHGIPLKKIENDVKSGPLHVMFNSTYFWLYQILKPYIFIKPDFILSTSPIMSESMASAFLVSKTQCLELGNPRLDRLYESRKKREKIARIIYLPTWRSAKFSLLQEAFGDINRLNSVLEVNNLHLDIKLHPNDMTTLCTYSHITLIDSKVDIYDIIAQYDLLITDYSSIYFDFLWLDREIVFYPFDYEKYVSEDRELYYAYEKVTPGKKVYDFEAFLRVIDNLSSLDYKNERKEIREQFFSHYDAKASRRLYDFFSESVCK